MAFNNITKVSNPQSTHNNFNRDNRPNVKGSAEDRAPVIRQIAPLTQYNTETGNVDVKEDSPWGIAAPSSDEVAEKVEKTAPESVDRHNAWKAEQAQKREERERGREEKAVRSQALAKDFLIKGDLVNAAKALNMSPSELATYIDNARLGIANKPETPKKLSLEEQVAKLNQELEESKKQAQEFNQNLQITNYIKENIVPELSANKEKYEVLHFYDAKYVQSQIYQLMNEHFQETGETLSVAEVAESLEEQLANIHKSSIEKLRAAKKFQDLFVPEAKKGKKVPANEELAERIDDGDSDYEAQNVDRSVMRNRNVNLTSEPYNPNASKSDNVSQKLINRNKKIEQAEAQADAIMAEITPKNATPRRSSSKEKIPYAFLSKEERMARLNEED
jgi:hypothetical protein